MSERTKIEWADSTASPWTPAKRYGWSREWGAGVPRHRFAGFERAVMAMERKAARGDFRECMACMHRWFMKRIPCGMQTCPACGTISLQKVRPRIFPSLCDWLDPEVPVEWLADLLDVIRRTPHLDHLLLTKRPGLWLERINAAGDHMRATRPDDASGTDHDLTEGWIHAWSNGVAPSNVWIGATVEDQAAEDERVPDLLRIPAARRFVSVEPMLGSVDLYQWLGGGLDWVICGGESGPGARPMHPDWARALRDQCVSSGVPFLFKQWGEWAINQIGYCDFGLKDRWGTVSPSGEWVDGADMDIKERYLGWAMMRRVGKERAGRLLDGREWNEMPKERG